MLFNWLLLNSIDHPSCRWLRNRLACLHKWCHKNQKIVDKLQLYRLFYCNEVHFSFVENRKKIQVIPSLKEAVLFSENKQINNLLFLHCDLLIFSELLKELLLIAFIHSRHLLQMRADRFICRKQILYFWVGMLIVRKY